MKSCGSDDSLPPAVVVRSGFDEIPPSAAVGGREVAACPGVDGIPPSAAVGGREVVAGSGVDGVPPSAAVGGREVVAGSGADRIPPSAAIDGRDVPARSAFDALDDFYAALANEARSIRVAAGCRACGVCCHFEEVEHTLFASAWEAAYLVNHAGPPPPPVRPGRCPYQQGERCVAHAWRPLGCRLYFCGADGDADAAFMETAHQRLKALHETTGVPWDYRPLFAHDGFRTP